jgi:hypothetical protein
VLLPGIAGELPNKKLLCGLIGRLFFYLSNFFADAVNE